jgi:cytoskeletal protein CcmA (bactofilin family)
MFTKPEEKKSVVDMVNSSNAISKETRIKGNIDAHGNIRIEGTVEGFITSKSKIVIGDSAVIKGNITSVEAEISGKVDGEVVCSEILYLKKTSYISGNIITRKLVVENGAVFDGQCQMNNKALKVSKKDREDEVLKEQLATG